MPSRSLLYLVLGVLAAPAIQATASEPAEVEDPAHDVEVHEQYPLVNAPSAEVDILSIDFRRDASALAIVVRVLDLERETIPGAARDYNIRFATDDAFHRAIARRNFAGDWVFFTIANNATTTLIPGEASHACSCVILHLGEGIGAARDIHGAAVLTHELTGPVPKTAWLRDWAPDEGTGTER